MKKMTSHDYAHNMQKMADWLLEREEFSIGDRQPFPYNFFSFGDKEKFLQAVKAVGQGKKLFGETRVQFELDLPFGHIRLEIPRNKICRLIRAAEFECEPFLSPEEEKSLGGAA